MSHKENINQLDALEPKKIQELLERQTILAFVKQGADEKAKTDDERRLEREKEKYTLLGGRVTSVFDEMEMVRKLMADVPVSQETKYSEFFQVLGDLESWTEQERKAYHKPPIAAKTINEVIYDRFPPELIRQIHSRNPYIKWCTRKYKIYYFLRDEAIIYLEQFIDEAVTLMKKCLSMYEFRVRHAEEFGSSFQPDLFKKLY